jgi:murein L,D-transpeptidase YafK
LARPIVIVCALASAADAQERAARSPCAGLGTSIHIDTKAHELRLCRANAAVAVHPVAIGKGGTPKRRQGDNKTPLGTYALGKPRPSKIYKTFIPIGYPTAEQGKKGYTGSHIGIHGPKRFLTWLGKLNALFDWTQGCVAVASDAEIDSIVAWVRKRAPAAVHIE